MIRDEEILGLIKVRGAISFSEIAAEMEISEEEAAMLVRRIFTKKLLVGAVNWEQGIVTARPDWKARQPDCPDCGGPTQIRPSGTRTCDFCGTEMHYAVKGNEKAVEYMFMKPEATKANLTRKVFTRTRGTWAGTIYLGFSLISSIVEIIMMTGGPGKTVGARILYYLAIVGLPILTIIFLALGIRGIIRAFQGNRVRLELRIINLIEAEGASSINKLSNILEISEAKVTGMLKEMERKHLFKVSINWHTGEIVMKGETGDTSDHRRHACPECGGHLAPADVRNERCPYCGSEVVA